MTADLSEFIALSAPRKPPCNVCTGRAQLSEQDCVNLDAALAVHEKRITNQAIAVWLGQRNVEAGWQQVLSHRKGKCSGICA